jgi:hypothetical protein
MQYFHTSSTYPEELIRLPDDFSIVCEQLEDIRDKMLEHANQNTISHLPTNYIYKYEMVMRNLDMVCRDLKDITGNPLSRIYININGHNIQDYVN